MPTCVPISELKDSATFAEKVARAGEPVIVTKNGYEQFVVIDADLFREYRRETPAEHLERLLQDADRDIRAGRLSDMREGLDLIRAQYGL